jgi:quercetin dioxygenase-like cupin family protein
MTDQPQFSVDVVAKAVTGIAGSVLQFPNGPTEIEAHLVELAPGGSVGRHQHPGPCVMYVLEGQVVTQLDDGTKHTYEAGEAFVEDAMTWVNNINPGSEISKFFAVAVGDTGAPKISFLE